MFWVMARLTRPMPRPSLFCFSSRPRGTVWMKITTRVKTDLKWCLFSERHQTKHWDLSKIKAGFWQKPYTGLFFQKTWKQSRLKAIAIRMEAIATRLEAIAIRFLLLLGSLYIYKSGGFAWSHCVCGTTSQISPPPNDGGSLGAPPKKRRAPNFGLRPARAWAAPGQIS